jgi:hypothetical protein
VRVHMRHCRECADRYRRALAYRRSVAGLAPVPVVCGDGSVGGVLEGGPHLARDSVVGLRHRVGQRFASKYGISPKLALNSLAYSGTKALALCAACITVATGGLASLARGSRHESGAQRHKSPRAVSSRARWEVVPADSRDHVRFARAATLREPTPRERSPTKRRPHRYRSRFVPPGDSRQLSVQPHPVAPPPPTSAHAPIPASDLHGGGQPDEFFAP